MGFRFGSACRLGLCALALSAPARASSVSVVPYAPEAGIAPPAAVVPLEIPDTLYPLEALIANEEGKTALNLLIDAAGRVTLAQVAQSSGSRRLDAQASGIATALWRFQPLAASEAPIAREMRIEIVWTLPLRPANEFPPPPPAMTAYGVRARIVMFDDARRSARVRPGVDSRSPCLARPILDNSVAPPKAKPGRIQVVEWLHRTEAGAFDDVLVQTAKGWMHVSESLMKSAGASPSVKSVAPPDTGRACWFYAALTIDPR